ncbi:MAG: bifunctional 2-methylcitrate dehydratase/aconitate hydratase [Betaproteobacteria bacterium]|nr:bifunctional 2-methylcitrate dehydratase/aconitate hydratase [Betaproteobacteria bacterium]
MSAHGSNVRPAPDQVLTDIADYVCGHEIAGAEAYRVARYCVIDALGCALEALAYPECTKLLGPVVPGIVVPHGARVPGTSFELDPVTAAFNTGSLIRWLDFNDSFTAAEGGHPSDNLGGILATADYLSRSRALRGKPPLAMRDVLTALIKAYEIQGVLSLENNFTRLGCDHAVLVRVASTATVTRMLGGGREEIINAVSNAWADGVTLKAYRQAPNTGTRKSWAGGDATSRAVRLALMALKGEMGYPSVLTAKTFGFYDALFRGQPFRFQRPYGSYVLENVMFKFVPAGMHSQTAVECAFKLHPLVKDRLDGIEAITIRSHEKLIGIMDKSGPLNNPADRDHCAQYVVAVGLIYGRLAGSDFEDEFAADPRIDPLRAKMKVVEDPRYTREFHDPAKRSSANAIEVRFRDGSSAPAVEVEYPVGHPRRRAEGIPMLEAKFRATLARRFPPRQQAAILEICLDQARFEATPADEFVDRFVI